MDDLQPTKKYMPTVPIEVALSKRLQRIIDDTEDEFNRLPTYVRPLAVRSLEAKTGQTIAEWRDLAASLTALLEEARARDEMAWDIFDATYPCLQEWLGKLIDYYHQAPAEIAGLVRDPDLVADLAHYAPQRETSLRFLLEALKRLTSRSPAGPASPLR